MQSLPHCALVHIAPKFHLSLDGSVGITYTYFLATVAGTPGVVLMKYSQLAVVLTCLVASYLVAGRMQ